MKIAGASLAVTAVAGAVAGALVIPMVSHTDAVSTADVALVAGESLVGTQVGLIDAMSANNDATLEALYNFVGGGDSPLSFLYDGTASPPEFGLLGGAVERFNEVGLVNQAIGYATLDWMLGHGSDSYVGDISDSLNEAIGGSGENAGPDSAVGAALAALGDAESYSDFMGNLLGLEGQLFELGVMDLAGMLNPADLF